MEQNEAASQENSPLVEVVQQKIKDPNIKVGSGCEWIGRGVEPQWEKSESTEDFVSEIGSKAVDGGYITDKEKDEFLKPILALPYIVC